MTQNQSAATNVRLLIQADRRLSNEHEQLYHVPASSEIAAIVAIKMISCYVDVGS